MVDEEIQLLQISDLFHWPQCESIYQYEELQVEVQFQEPVVIKSLQLTCKFSNQDDIKKEDSQESVQTYQNSLPQQEGQKQQQDQQSYMALGNLQWAHLVVYARILETPGTSRMVRIYSIAQEDTSIQNLHAQQFRLNQGQENSSNEPSQQIKQEYNNLDQNLIKDDLLNNKPLAKQRYLSYNLPCSFGIPLYFKPLCDKILAILQFQTQLQVLRLESLIKADDAKNSTRQRASKKSEQSKDKMKLNELKSKLKNQDYRTSINSNQIVDQLIKDVQKLIPQILQARNVVQQYYTQQNQDAQLSKQIYQKLYQCNKSQFKDVQNIPRLIVQYNEDIFKTLEQSAIDYLPLLEYVALQDSDLKHFEAPQKQQILLEIQDYYGYIYNNDQRIVNLGLIGLISAFILSTSEQGCQIFKQPIFSQIFGGLLRLYDKNTEYENIPNSFIIFSPLVRKLLTLTIYQILLVTPEVIFNDISQLPEKRALEEKFQEKQKAEIKSQDLATQKKKSLDQDQYQENGIAIIKDQYYDLKQEQQENSSYLQQKSEEKSTKQRSKQSKRHQSRGRSKSKHDRHPSRRRRDVSHSSMHSSQSPSKNRAKKQSQESQEVTHTGDIDKVQEQIQKLRNKLNNKILRKETEHGLEIQPNKMEMEELTQEEEKKQKKNKKGSGKGTKKRKKESKNKKSSKRKKGFRSLSRSASKSINSESTNQSRDRDDGSVSKRKRQQRITASSKSPTASQSIGAKRQRSLSRSRSRSKSVSDKQNSDLNRSPSYSPKQHKKHRKDKKLKSKKDKKRSKMQHRSQSHSASLSPSRQNHSHSPKDYKSPDRSLSPDTSQYHYSQQQLYGENIDKSQYDNNDFNEQSADKVEVTLQDLLRSLVDDSEQDTETIQNDTSINRSLIYMLQLNSHIQEISKFTYTYQGLYENLLQDQKQPSGEELKSEDIIIEGKIPILNSCVEKIQQNKMAIEQLIRTIFTIPYESDTQEHFKQSTQNTSHQTKYSNQQVVSIISKSKLWESISSSLHYLFQIIDYISMQQKALDSKQAVLLETYQNLENNQNQSQLDLDNPAEQDFSQGSFQFDELEKQKILIQDQACQQINEILGNLKRKITVKIEPITAKVEIILAHLIGTDSLLNQILKNVSSINEIYQIILQRRQQHNQQPLLIFNFLQSIQKWEERIQDLEETTKTLLKIFKSGETISKEEVSQEQERMLHRIIKLIDMIRIGMNDNQIQKALYRALELHSDLFDSIIQLIYVSLDKNWIASGNNIQSIQSIQQFNINKRQQTNISKALKIKLQVSFLQLITPFLDNDYFQTLSYLVVDRSKAISQILSEFESSVNLKSTQQIIQTLNYTNGALEARLMNQNSDSAKQFEYLQDTLPQLQSSRKIQKKIALGGEQRQSAMENLQQDQQKMEKILFDTKLQGKIIGVLLELYHLFINQIDQIQPQQDMKVDDQQNELALENNQNKEHQQVLDQDQLNLWQVFIQSLDFEGLQVLRRCLQVAEQFMTSSLKQYNWMLKGGDSLGIINVETTLKNAARMLYMSSKVFAFYFRSQSQLQPKLMSTDIIITLLITYRKIQNMSASFSTPATEIQATSYYVNQSQSYIIKSIRIWNSKGYEPSPFFSIFVPKNVTLIDQDPYLEWCMQPNSTYALINFINDMLPQVWPVNNSTQALDTSSQQLVEEDTQLRNEVVPVTNRELRAQFANLFNGFQIQIQNIIDTECRSSVGKVRDSLIEMCCRIACLGGLQPAQIAQTFIQFIAANKETNLNQFQNITFTNLLLIVQGMVNCQVLKQAFMELNLQHMLLQIIQQCMGQESNKVTEICIEILAMFCNKNINFNSNQQDQIVIEQLDLPKVAHMQEIYVASRNILQDMASHAQLNLNLSQQQQLNYLSICRLLNFILGSLKGLFCIILTNDMQRGLQDFEPENFENNLLGELNFLEGLLNECQNIKVQDDLKLGQLQEVEALSSRLKGLKGILANQVELLQNTWRNFDENNIPQYAVSVQERFEQLQEASIQNLTPSQKIKLQEYDEYYLSLNSIHDSVSNETFQSHFYQYRQFQEEQVLELGNCKYEYTQMDLSGDQEQELQDEQNRKISSLFGVGANIRMFSRNPELGPYIDDAQLESNINYEDNQDNKLDQLRRKDLLMIPSYIMDIDDGLFSQRHRFEEQQKPKQVQRLQIDRDDFIPPITAPPGRIREALKSKMGQMLGRPTSVHVDTYQQQSQKPISQQQQTSKQSSHSRNKDDDNQQQQSKSQDDKSKSEQIANISYSQRREQELRAKQQEAYRKQELIQKNKQREQQELERKHREDRQMELDRRREEEKIMQLKQQQKEQAKRDQLNQIEKQQQIDKQRQLETEEQNQMKQIEQHRAEEEKLQRYQQQQKEQQIAQQLLYEQEIKKQEQIEQQKQQQEMDRQAKLMEDKQQRKQFEQQKQEELIRAQQQQIKQEQDQKYKQDFIDKQEQVTQEQQQDRLRQLELEQKDQVKKKLLLDQQEREQTQKDIQQQNLQTKQEQELLNKSQQDSKQHIGNQQSSQSNNVISKQGDKVVDDLHKQGGDIQIQKDQVNLSTQSIADIMKDRKKLNEIMTSNPSLGNILREKLKQMQRR